MDAVLEKFLKELKDLECLIDFYETENELLKDFNVKPVSDEELIISELSKKLKAFRLSKLQFNYNCVIISLYGSFESFIEDCLVSYIDELNKIVQTYNNLPDTVAQNHFALSLSLISKIDQPKYSGPLTKELIIKNLHTCINTIEKYELNKDAFAQHSANFRQQVIDDSFSQIGIKTISQKIIDNSDFRNYSILHLGLNDEDTLLPSECFEFLNNLAELRNRVAHGISSEIIRNDLLLDYVKFFKHYSHAITEILKTNILYREIDEYGVEFGPITDVFQSGKIICFMSNKVPLAKGDVIIGKSLKTIIKSIVKSIKVDGNQVDSIDGSINIEVGIEIEHKFKKKYKLYSLKKV
jgi:uncharacterized protein YutE (UPF0331/DUF86 family)